MFEALEVSLNIRKINEILLFFFFFPLRWGLLYRRFSHVK